MLIGCSTLGQEYCNLAKFILEINEKASWTYMPYLQIHGWMRIKMLIETSMSMVKYYKYFSIQVSAPF